LLDRSSAPRRIPHKTPPDRVREIVRLRRLRLTAAGLLCGLVTLAITLSLRGSLLRPSSWGTCPPNTIDSASGDPAPASG
jgi:hypothetical protein